jgi:hypothetical protein
MLFIVSQQRESETEELFYKQGGSQQRPCTAAQVYSELSERC